MMMTMTLMNEELINGVFLLTPSSTMDDHQTDDDASGAIAGEHHCRCIDTHKMTTAIRKSSSSWRTRRSRSSSKYCRDNYLIIIGTVIYLTVLSSVAGEMTNSGGSAAVAHNRPNSLGNDEGGGGSYDGHLPANSFSGSNVDEERLSSSSSSSRSTNHLSSRIVHTKYGAISGVIVHLENRHLDPVEAYKGIPYASPPVGSLRFMPPVSGALWSGVRKADKFGPVCPQKLPDIRNDTLALQRMPRGRLDYLRRLLSYLQDQSEDCLYLNIYAPIMAGARDTGTGGSTAKYPVLVFVHGESYEWNSGNPYDGSVLASFGQMVVVTVNYRLGVLGFLNANADRSARAPANYGLMDIIAALHWIQENIEAFGGNPRSVTVAGHGTGAACVNFLMASSAVPEGLLFHRAALMSGSGLSPWSLVNEPLKYAAHVAHHVKCPTDAPHSQLMKCLRERPLEALLSAPIRAPEFGNAFGPSVDGVVVDTGDVAVPPDLNVYEYIVPNGSSVGRYPPNTLSTINSVFLQKQAISKLTRYDLMLGVTRAESYFTFSSDDVQYGIEAGRRSKILRTYVRNTYSFHLNEILATIINEYTDWERPVQHPINIRDETLDALSDAQVVAPAALTADLHSQDHRNSYLYVFDYQTKFGDYAPRQGCIHGEDLPYIFGAPLVGGFNHFTRNYTKSEVALSESVMLYWSNFVRTGNPNEPHQETEHGGGAGGNSNSNSGSSAQRQERTRQKNIEWTAYESVHKKYLNFDTKPKLKNHYRAHRLSFWLNLVPDLHKPGNDDVPDSHHQLDESATDDVDTLSDGLMVKPINPPKQPQKKDNYNPHNAPQFVMNLSLPVPRSVNGSKVIAPSVIHGAEANEGGNSNNNNNNNNQEDGFAAYSTALSVTIAIGCSLLILNVLIFAGVYYQRDKTRLNDSQHNLHHHQHKKRSENGGGGGSGGGGSQMPNNICGDMDVHNQKGGEHPSSILSHHHQLAHHQLPPPEFADLPQRAPPPPKHLKSHPSADGQMMSSSHALQLMGSGGGGSVSGGIMVGTLQKKSSLKPGSTSTLTKNTNSHNLMQQQQQQQQLQQQSHQQQHQQNNNPMDELRV